MAFVYMHGRTRISSRKPIGFRVCDRCGCQYSRNALSWQYQWQGATLQNLRILVCPTCLDRPQPQLRVYVPPPDPLPFWNPRPELDRGWPMQTYVLRSNNGTIIRANDSSVITVIGAAGQQPQQIVGSDGQVVWDNGITPSIVLSTYGGP